VWRDRFWQDARANLGQIIEWCEAGRVRPVVSRTEQLVDAVQALTAIASREVVGKVVLVASHSGQDLDSKGRT